MLILSILKLNGRSGVIVPSIMEKESCVNYGGYADYKTIMK